MNRLAEAKRIIVKTGSALIADKSGARADWLAGLADDIAQLRARGQQVLLVSSGAIALGRGVLGPNRPARLEDKQAAAALGQPRLMQAMHAAFAPHQIMTAQALLTLEDTETRRRWLNGRATLETLLDAGALPIINENDTVATDEIRYGDNDRLAARVAQMMSADALVLLSDIDGLYTADPQSNPQAQHIPFLGAIEPEHKMMAGNSNHKSNVGSGGMATKLAAAEIAYAAGCATVIARGDVPHPLLQFDSDVKCTWILPDISPGKARRIWLQSHLNTEGAVVVDEGAASALMGGSSLLAVGVTSVTGEFKRGAAIEILNTQGDLLAKGITAYSAADINAIAGLKSEAAQSRLGFKGRPAIIHRNDLVLI